MLPATTAEAPSLTWIPFCAICVVGPMPVTVVPVIDAVEPLPSTAMPSF